jgi:type VI protein secretion system component VasF
MDTELRDLNFDYRTRINHLINAITELSGAVAYLSRKLEDTADEGIAEDVQRRVEAVREYVSQAGWEL